MGKSSIAGSSKWFSGREIFLDVPEREKRDLGARLKHLGANVASFFSASCSMLVTARQRESGNDEFPPPGPTPAFSGPYSTPGACSSLNSSDSGMVHPDDDRAPYQRPKTSRRAERMVTKRVDAHNPDDIVHRARQLRIEVWTVDRLVKVLRSSKARNRQRLLKAKRGAPQAPNPFSNYIARQTMAKHEKLAVRPNPLGQGHKSEEREIVNLEQGGRPGHFPAIIVEDLSGEYVPFFKEFPLDEQGISTAPALNWNAPPGACPWFWDYTEEEMRRPHPAAAPPAAPKKLLVSKSKKKSKEKSKTKEKGAAKKKRKEVVSGWCECCKVHYDDFDQHIVADLHRQFALKDENYDQIDAYFSEINSSKPSTSMSPFCEASDSCANDADPPMELVPALQTDESAVGAGQAVGQAIEPSSAREDEEELQGEGVDETASDVAPLKANAPPMGRRGEPGEDVAQTMPTPVPKRKKKNPILKRLEVEMVSPVLSPRRRDDSAFKAPMQPAKSKPRSRGEPITEERKHNKHAPQPKPKTTPEEEASKKEALNQEALAAQSPRKHPPPMATPAGGDNASAAAAKAARVDRRTTACVAEKEAGEAQTREQKSKKKGAGNAGVVPEEAVEKRKAKKEMKKKKKKKSAGSKDEESKDGKRGSKEDAKKQTGEENTSEEKSKGETKRINKDDASSKEKRKRRSPRVKAAFNSPTQKNLQAHANKVQKYNAQVQDAGLDAMFDKDALGDVDGTIALLIGGEEVSRAVTSGVQAPSSSLLDAQFAAALENVISPARLPARRRGGNDDDDGNGVEVVPPEVGDDDGVQPKRLKFDEKRRRRSSSDSNKVLSPPAKRARRGEKTPAARLLLAASPVAASAAAAPLHAVSPLRRALARLIDSDTFAAGSPTTAALVGTPRGGRSAGGGGRGASGDSMLLSPRRSARLPPARAAVVCAPGTEECMMSPRRSARLDSSPHQTITALTAAAPGARASAALQDGAAVASENMLMSPRRPARARGNRTSPDLDEAMARVLEASPRSQPLPSQNGLEKHDEDEDEDEGEDNSDESVDVLSPCRSGRLSSHGTPTERPPAVRRLNMQDAAGGATSIPGTVSGSVAGEGAVLRTVSAPVRLDAKVPEAVKRSGRTNGMRRVRKKTATVKDSDRAESGEGRAEVKRRRILMRKRGKVQRLGLRSSLLSSEDESSDSREAAQGTPGDKRTPLPGMLALGTPRSRYDVKPRRRSRLEELRGGRTATTPSGSSAASVFEFHTASPTLKLGGIAGKRKRPNTGGRARKKRCV